MGGSESTTMAPTTTTTATTQPEQTTSITRTTLFASTEFTSIATSISETTTDDVISSSYQFSTEANTDFSNDATKQTLSHAFVSSQSTVETTFDEQTESTFLPSAMSSTMAESDNHVLLIALALLLAFLIVVGLAILIILLRKRRSGLKETETMATGDIESNVQPPGYDVLYKQQNPTNDGGYSSVQIAPRKEDEGTYFELSNGVHKSQNAKFQNSQLEEGTYDHLDTTRMSKQIHSSADSSLCLSIQADGHFEHSNVKESFQPEEDTYDHLSGAGSGRLPGETKSEVTNPQSAGKESHLHTNQSRRGEFESNQSEDSMYDHLAKAEHSPKHYSTQSDNDVTTFVQSEEGIYETISEKTVKEVESRETKTIDQGNGPVPIVKYSQVDPARKQRTEFNQSQDAKYIPSQSDKNAEDNLCSTGPSDGRISKHEQSSVAYENVRPPGQLGEGVLTHGQSSVTYENTVI